MKTLQNKNEVPKKGAMRKWLFVSLGIAATGTITFFGWQYFKKKKKQLQTSENEMPDMVTQTADSYIPKSSGASNRNDNFPLKKGSKGANVKALQEALIAKHGSSILPKYGADGDFGSELVAALKKVGLPEQVNETTFNVLVKGSSLDATTTAKALYMAAVAKRFDAVLVLLKTIRNVNDYKAVSDVFVTYRLGAVRQTLVNGLLNTFSSDDQKEKLRLAFSAMGLKYDGEKWSLSGVDDNLIITMQPTKVWKNPNEAVSVPTNMVLGKEVTKRGEYTLFENDKQHFLVQTSHVKFYNN